MTSGWTVPAGLRLLLDDIIHALLDDAVTTTPLDTRQIYRLVADFLESWVDQRTQLELVSPTASLQLDSDRPRKNGTDEDKGDRGTTSKADG